MVIPEMDKFATICMRISLNLPPSCQWHWDDRFNLALVVFEREDYELVYMPILLEFEHRWDCFSLSGASEVIKEHTNGAFGLIPGQEIFTAAGTENHSAHLFATLWPWGDDKRYSLRVGLIAPGLNREEIKIRLTDWLKINS